MGRMMHDAVVVVTHDGRPGGLPDMDAFRAGLRPEFRPLVVGPVVTRFNGCAMYAFLPDGSKEGWPPSDEGDRAREAFKDLFRHRYNDGSTGDEWTHVRFGDRDGDGRHTAEITEAHLTRINQGSF
jgi:hypothetical protein